jgi:chloride channel 3/4/5
MCQFCTTFPGIVAEEADHLVLFHPTTQRFRTLSSSSLSSIFDRAEDPFDFSVYMDKARCHANPYPRFYSSVTQAPLTISINSPLELVQQFFVKLGARYVVVTDTDGYCELFFFSSTDGDESHLEQFERFADKGAIDKNGWLAFLDELTTKPA